MIVNIVTAEMINPWRDILYSQMLVELIRSTKNINYKKKSMEVFFNAKQNRVNIIIN